MLSLILLYPFYQTEILALHGYINFFFTNGFVFFIGLLVFSFSLVMRTLPFVRWADGVVGLGCHIIM